MSELLKERVLVVLALVLCIAVSLVATCDTPDLSPVGVIYSDKSGTSKATIVSSNPDTSVPDTTESVLAVSVESAATSSKKTSNIKTAAGKTVIDKKTEKQTVNNKTTAHSDSQLININIATAKELESLPGIGEAIAQRIIDYRETHGGFDSIEEIMNVSGIAEKRFANIKNLISID